MHVVILVNPSSGAGRGRAASLLIEAGLREAGYGTRRVEGLDDPARLDEALRGGLALVVAGGDGTVRAAAAPAMRAGVPLYHFPCGTVNLFGRTFGMDRSVATLLGALRRREVRPVDAGEVNGETFLLMVSIGYDAGVVHRVTSGRGEAISRASYLWPMLREMLAWRPPWLAVTVDGTRVDGGEPGMVVVANSRHYMWGFNPAARADMTDGLLDVVFFPTSSKAQLLRWMARCLVRRHLAHPRLVYRRGTRVAIACPHPQRVQMDGDPAPGRRPLAELAIAVRPGALRVLVPAH